MIGKLDVLKVSLYILFNKITFNLFNFWVEKRILLICLRRMGALSSWNTD